ncbi:hypothetical protein BH09SUM1_BH09SUM1_32870 [soil metagenome]
MGEEDDTFEGTEGFLSQYSGDMSSESDVQMHLRAALQRGNAKGPADRESDVDGILKPLQTPKDIA